MMLRYGRGVSAMIFIPFIGAGVLPEKQVYTSLPFLSTTTSTASTTTTTALLPPILLLLPLLLLLLIILLLPPSHN